MSIQVIQDPYRKGTGASRFGAGIGQGLAEQVPKEVERYRLASGLKNFEQESGNLSPLQQLARLSSIPGMTPEMIRQFGELAKQQSMRSNYSRTGNTKTGQPISNAVNSFIEQSQNMPFAGIDQTKIKQTTKTGQPEIARGEPLGEEQIASQNPLSSEFKTRARWTPERFENEIDKIIRANPFMDINIAEKIASDNESRELAQPEAYQAEYARLDKIKDDLNNNFRNKLGLKLQKNISKNGEIPQEVYKDITGENIAAMERAMQKELAKNPKANIEDLADEWSTKALNLSKAKNILKGLEKGSFIDLLRPGKWGTLNEKIKNASKIYADTGNSEELYNTLINDFDMSPQGAASKAFPPSKNLNNYLNKIKFSPNTNRASENAIKYAYDTRSLITDDDSILSIARDIYEKDPLFDQYSFFKTMSSLSDGLNDRQQRELIQGQQNNIIPTWGDFWITRQVR